MSRAAQPRRRSLPHGRGANLPSSARGFSLIAVIFMIVVLAALGAFAVSISLSQQQTNNLALLEARTAAAAQAGIEYGAYMVLASPANCAALPNPPTLSGGALAGYTVTVACVRGDHPGPGGTTKYSYALTATATTGAYGTADFVSRQASLTVTSP